jgi:hypothetical protein
MASAAFLPIQAKAAVTKPVKTVQFKLNVSAGAAKCLPQAVGYVSDHTTGPVEVLSVYVTGLPPNTDFDFFIIQVPNAPFGLTWYQGDIETDSHGVGSGYFVGRFSIETFIVAPGATSASQVFTSPPFPDAKFNPQTAPVQLYHLGLWFNNPSDAAKAGCANTVTPFNGEHNAGIQVLNSANATFNGFGPLFQLQ